MSEVCCASNPDPSSPERCVWSIREEIKAGREWIPWTGECYCPEGEEPCTCTCKCDPLKPGTSRCLCECDGCVCSEYVSWRNPQRLEDLEGRNPDGG